MKSTDPVNKRKKISRRLKIAMIPVGGLLALIVLYQIATASWFIQKVVLPRVAAQLNSEIQVENIEVQPFRRIKIDGLTLTPKGRETLLKAGSVEAEYDLWKILKGNLEVSRVDVSGASITVMEDADGQGNLNQLLKALEGDENEPETEDEDADQGFQLAIGPVVLKDCRLSYRKAGADGSVQQIEAPISEFRLDRLFNDGSQSEIRFASALIYRQESGQNADVLEAQLEGSVRFDLNPQLLPSQVELSLNGTAQSASGTFEPLRNKSLALSVAHGGNALKEFKLEARDGEARFGTVEASGPLNLATLDADLNVKMEGIDRTLLNLTGLDFADTRIQSTIQLKHSGTAQELEFESTSEAAAFSFELYPDLPLPPVNATVQAAGTWNSETSALDLRTLSASAEGDSVERVTLEMTSPFRLAITGEGFNVSNSEFQLNLHRLDLAPWTQSIGMTNVQGALTGAAEIQTDADNQTIGLTATHSIQGLNHPALPRPTEAALEIESVLTSFDEFQLNRFQARLGSPEDPVLNASGSGAYTLSSGALSSELQFKSELPTLAGFLSLEGVKLDSGTLEMNASQSGALNNLTTDLTVDVSDAAFEASGVAMDRVSAQVQTSNVLTETAFTIKSGSARIQRDGIQAADVSLTGEFAFSGNALTMDLSVSNVTETLLAPLLKPYVSNDMNLRSARFDWQSKIEWNPENASTITLDGNLSGMNWDRQELSALKWEDGFRIQADIRQDKDALTLNSGSLTLPKTDRASNQIALSGKMQLVEGKPQSGRLQVQSDSLDFTPLYDLISSTNETAASEAPEDSAEPAPDPQPEADEEEAPQEPAPVTLPMAEFEFALDVNRLYLRSLEATNLTSRLVWTNNVVELNPFSLSVSNAPVSASLYADLNKTGYVYRIKASADGVPFRPIAQSFLAKTQKESAGEIYVSADLEGAGVTGKSLRENLKGTTSLVFTNAVIPLVGKPVRFVLLPIATLLRSPGLLKPPANLLHVDLQFADGKIQLQKTTLASPAFKADVVGTLPIADNFGETPVDLPLKMAIRKSLLGKSKLLDGDDESTYTDLPDFVTLKGTLDGIEVKLDKLAISGLVITSALDLTGRTGLKVGEGAFDVLKGVGGVLNPLKSDKENGAEKQKANPLDLLKILPGQKDKEEPKPEEEKK